MKNDDDEINFLSRIWSKTFITLKQRIWNVSLTQFFVVEIDSLNEYVWFVPYTMKMA